jgi:ABC-type uncharacterized transport system auxiliary subunit
MRSQTTALKIIVIGATLLLAGCFGTEVKDEFFYQLTGPTKALEKGKGPKILLASFSAAAGYDSPRIVFRSSKHEIQYWGYRQWAAEPTRLLAEMTLRHMRASGLFSDVTTSDRMREPDAIIEATVNAIEQVDHEKSWDARLAMTIVVRKGMGEQVLLRHAFDATRPCERRHPDEVAKGVSRILEDEIRRLAPRIAAALR